MPSNDRLRQNDPNIGVKIHQTAYVAKLVYNFNAFNAFLAWLRCLKVPVDLTHFPLISLLAPVHGPHLRPNRADHCNAFRVRLKVFQSRRPSRPSDFLCLVLQRRRPVGNLRHLLRFTSTNPQLVPDLAILSRFLHCFLRGVRSRSLSFPHHGHDLPVAVRHLDGRRQPAGARAIQQGAAFVRSFVLVLTDSIRFWALSSSSASSSSWPWCFSTCFSPSSCRPTGCQSACDVAEW
eukprot:74882-Hanusia_phi.AAC.2